MSHVAPGVGRIGSVIACAILADLETGAFSCDSQIHNALLVDCRLDCVGITRLVQFQSHILAVEAGLWLVKAIVA